MRNEPATPVAVTLPATAGASAQARRIVGEAVATWGVSPDVAEDAALVVTELVSNAVDHATGPLELAVSRTAQGIRIEVSDRSPTMPEPRPVQVDSARGRGLIIVAALSREWGTSPTADGKTVWAELA
ncbi:ATP-binding protein [Saccharothrix australiensis]|uniref:Histidine kinase-like protein n=1 Tax=Saccharothrix australiensis TaxID=2072 RepID=A0A495W4E8_9PSEU|nr:ATP-binding protein [Saccharothrix australiensis]RKT56254.1 histidine kinase-like protein [Saccharothrix australiensis]